MEVSNEGQRPRARRQASRPSAHQEQPHNSVGDSKNREADEYNANGISLEVGIREGHGDRVMGQVSLTEELRYCGWQTGENLRPWTNTSCATPSSYEIILSVPERTINVDLAICDIIRLDCYD